MNERQRKLSFRAWRRGFREMDLILGSFADKYIEDMTEIELNEFERILAVPDWDAFAWITGSKETPPDQDGPILRRLKEFRYTIQAG